MPLLEGGVGFVEGVLDAGGLFAEELAAGEGFFTDLPGDWFGEGFDEGEGFFADLPGDWFWEGFDEGFCVVVRCELVRVEDPVEVDEAWRLRP